MLLSVPRSSCLSTLCLGAANGIHMVGLARVCRITSGLIQQKARPLAPDFSPLLTSIQACLTRNKNSCHSGCTPLDLTSRSIASTILLFPLFKSFLSLLSFRQPCFASSDSSLAHFYQQHTGSSFYGLAWFYVKHTRPEFYRVANPPSCTRIAR